MDPMDLMARMSKAGFPMGEFLISKGNGEAGISVWFSDAACEVMADICLIAEWMDTKPVRSS